MSENECCRTVADTAPERRRFPRWLHKQFPAQGMKDHVERCVRGGMLHTVCEEARCPNRAECFSRGTATFLLLGDTCTRTCGFCSVNHGTPSEPDPLEQQRVCDAVRAMGLSYVVCTMVSRDDLPDGGAAHLAETIALLKRNPKQPRIEVLISDFGGNLESLETVLLSSPDILNHNVETVQSLYSRIRPEADFRRSLNLFRSAARIAPSIPLKSGFMVGLGETAAEVGDLLRELSGAGVSIVTIGQYLQPSKRQVAVHEFVEPETFQLYREAGLAAGIREVVAGPFVRSSYHAAETYTRARIPDGA